MRAGDAGGKGSTTGDDTDRRRMWGVLGGFGRFGGVLIANFGVFGRLKRTKPLN